MLRTRPAELSEIDRLHAIRIAVKENALSNPDLITSKEYSEFPLSRDKGWAAEIDNTIAGFAICDLQDENIWALFVHPDFEKRRVARVRGRREHERKSFIAKVDGERMVCMEKKLVWR